MEISILEDRANPLLKRREYRFEIAHATAATPSRDAVRGELAKLVKAPKDRVIIERMHARYGTATTRGDALVYETVDAAKKIVRTHILVRNGLVEKPAAGTPPAAAPAAPAAPAKPETAAEPKPEAPAPAKTEPKPEVKHEPKHEAKHEGKHESKPEAKEDAKPEEKAEHPKPHGKGKGAKAAKSEPAPAGE